MVFAILLILFCTLSLNWSCKLDQREALLYATRVGRASQIIFRECMNLMVQVKPQPPSELASRFLKSICDAGNKCVESLQTTAMKVITPCVRDKMWKIWGDHPMYSFEAKKQVEKAMVCAAEAAEDAKVAWLATAMALRITG
ncbi:uncharacterized protein LOC144145253 isoform X1 [Haemaphysalis longicornis]